MFTAAVFGTRLPVPLARRDRGTTDRKSTESSDHTPHRPPPSTETDLQRSQSAPGVASTAPQPSMDALPDLSNPPSPALQDVFSQPKYSTSADLYHQTLHHHETEILKLPNDTLSSGTSKKRSLRMPEQYDEHLDFQLSPKTSHFPLDYDHIDRPSHSDLPDANDNFSHTTSRTETPMTQAVEHLRNLRLDSGVPTIMRKLSEHISRDVFVAVIGANNSGKSTFIQRCHDLQSMPAKGLSAKPYKVEDGKYSIKLVEMYSHKLIFGKSGAITWPESNDGERLPHVDGILMLYDVTNKSSTERVPEFLSRFCRANIPTLLVACKCDTPRELREVEVQTIEHLADTLGVEVMHTGAKGNGDSQKACVDTLFWMFVSQKENRQRPLPGRRRATSSANTPRSESPKPTPVKGAHSRASSEFSVSTVRQPHLTSSDLNNVAGGRSSRSKSTSNTRMTSPDPSALASSRAYNRDFSPQYSPSPEPFAEGLKEENAHKASSSSRRPKSLTIMPHSSDTSISQSSFSDLDSDSFPFPKEDASKLRHNDGNQRGERYAGIPLEELVARLLAAPMSKADSNFATVFFCFYRKFAAPRDLLNSILAAFDRSNEKQQSKLIQTNDQLRYCAVLHQWASNYPGDFAHAHTRQNLKDLADGLQKERAFAGVAKDILAILDAAIEDEDASWGRIDSESHRNSLHSFMTHSTSGSNETGTASDDSWDHCNPGASSADLHKDANPTSTPAEQAGPASLQSLADPLHQFPHVIREQYMFFMDIPEENIMKELTRIDWSLFSLIKPRDFVRHVSVPANEKESDKSLEHINRLIRHFNQVAYWVAALVLERPKPKHRARALEKFMNIAWLLRHNNNYNSLGAVIAGINGLALHRLTLTRSLVSEVTQKRFMALEILMGTRKSHFSYRLAMENTTGPCIPFIPLHRRDLVSADEGNRTFLVNNINWRKFEIMGDVLMVILRCQATPYEETTPSTWTQKLILDASASVNDDELMGGFQDLYERSVQLEPGLHQMDSQRQKRSWFGKR